MDFKYVVKNHNTYKFMQKKFFSQVILVKYNSTLITGRKVQSYADPIYKIRQLLTNFDMILTQKMSCELEIISVGRGCVRKADFEDKFE